MTMNFLLTMAATAAPIATEAATPTGSRAGKILGILLALVLLIGFLVIVIGWAVSKTKNNDQTENEDEIEENSESFFEMPAEEELAIESELEFEFEKVDEGEDDLSAFFFKPKETEIPEEIEVVEEEATTIEVKESFWNIPADSTLTDSSGTKYRFYDYHKNDRTKLWGLASDDNDTMKLMALEDIVKIESEDSAFSTVKLARGILVIEGSKISYVDSLTGKSLPAHSTIKSKIRYETLPEGKIIENGAILGEIISSKVDYRSGGPAFFYQDENGTPRRKRFSEITKLEITSNGNYFVERVIDSDMLCITSLSAMMIIDVNTGIIVANSKS